MLYKYRLSSIMACTLSFPDSIYNVSAHGFFRTYKVKTARRAGDNVTFSCKRLFYKVPYKTVTCTESGNYSLPPPYCKEKKRDYSK